MRHRKKKTEKPPPGVGGGSLLESWCLLQLKLKEEISQKIAYCNQNYLVATKIKGKQKAL